LKNRTLVRRVKLLTDKSVVYVIQEFKNQNHQPKEGLNSPFYLVLVNANRLFATAKSLFSTAKRLFATARRLFSTAKRLFATAKRLSAKAGNLIIELKSLNY
jgi:hypothetical protein